MLLYSLYIDDRDVYIMKVAVIDSRNLYIDHLEKYLPEDATEIVSGGAKGIDTCARKYAIEHHTKLTEFLPEYDKYVKTKLTNNRVYRCCNRVLGWTIKRYKVCDGKL